MKTYQSKTCEWDGWAAQTSGGYRVGGRGSLAGMARASDHTGSAAAMPHGAHALGMTRWETAPEPCGLPAQTPNPRLIMTAASDKPSSESVSTVSEESA